RLITNKNWAVRGGGGSYFAFTQPFAPQHSMSSDLSQSFSKADRILKRDHFKRVYEGGRKVHTRFFTAFILPNSGEGPRLGITATRKIGNAVERNRARRLLREAFRKNKWLAPRGVDIVINVKRSLVEAALSDLEDDFINFLEGLSVE
ncbi:MAG TPA: ribonuclease P protein component, partial [Blastocatellia bacterium]